MPLDAASITPHLQACGYKLLRRDFALDEGVVVPLVAFSNAPADARSACVAILEKAKPTPGDVAALRGLGAPVVFVCTDEGLEWWKQSARAPERIGGIIPPSNVAKFFDSHHDEFQPTLVYRAKTWGRYEKEYQLSFVDLGLMPLVEGEIGERLVGLIIRNVDHLKSTLGWKALNEVKAQWLLKVVFWLISAKILRDKSVGRFTNLDLLDVGNVFELVGAHFGTKSVDVNTDKQWKALSDLAADIARFSSLELATTESLAYVYENALVSKATRKALGTHSTPAFLVDYIVGRLGKQIELIPKDERNVFEPACGHAAFLVSAIRYLTDLLPEEQRANAARRTYLRKRVHGIETDLFALEIARLSLSLTDIPNPNGWDLKPDDMFIGDALEEQSRTATIFLSNPPFENFTDEEKGWYATKGVFPRHASKVAEVFGRALPELPTGAVIGIVAPQGILHSRDADPIRKLLLEQFDLKEICLFPDSVFKKADSEPCIILGTKRRRSTSATTTYSRVREYDYESFQKSYWPSFRRDVDQQTFWQRPSHDMRFADLADVWQILASQERIDTIADMGKGLEFEGEHLPNGARTYQLEWFEGAKPAFVHFDCEHIHKMPTEFWANLSDDVIRRPGSGTTVGKAQVLINYAPVSRGPWRLRALLDLKGHAITSRFISIRPKSEEASLEFLWALFNNPLANAFAFAHLMKRDVLVSEMRKLPVPKAWRNQGTVVSLVKEYFALFDKRTKPDPDTARRCLLQVDAEVLRLYDLPPNIERQILDLFGGRKRLGVTFDMQEYIPKSFKEAVSLHEYIDITDDWPRVNQRRDALIRKKAKKLLSSAEKPELSRLQRLAALRQQLIAPLPLEELERVSKALVGMSMTLVRQK